MLPPGVGGFETDTKPERTAWVDDAATRGGKQLKSTDKHACPLLTGGAV
jgi:hypothetical protein